jgi:hypothetical protein
MANHPSSRGEEAGVMGSHTNATLEGLNSIIQNAKCQARGFRNDEYFKAIIYLVAGQINLDEVCPHVSAKVTHSI